MPGYYRFEVLSSPDEMAAHFDLILQLNADMKMDDYVSMLKEMVRAGYKQVAVFEGEKCVGISGYWIATKLYSGKYLEPDNVVIDIDHRSKGIGKLLCEWLCEEARRNNCKTVM